MLKLRYLLLLILCAVVLAGCDVLGDLMPAEDSVAPVAPTAAPTWTVAPARTATTARTAAPARTATGSTGAVACKSSLVGGQTPNLPTISLDNLIRCRPEVKRTYDLILKNGPFPYSQDDVVFQNRERFLPAASMGTYHEYTVVTPGASTRGARRLISGGKVNRRPKDFDRLYYTDDHYDSFWLVNTK